jgi:hypothetical protein
MYAPSQESFAAGQAIRDVHLHLYAAGERMPGQELMLAQVLGKINALYLLIRKVLLGE